MRKFRDAAYVVLTGFEVTGFISRILLIISMITLPVAGLLVWGGSQLLTNGYEFLAGLVWIAAAVVGFFAVLTFSFFIASFVEIFKES